MTEDYTPARYQREAFKAWLNYYEKSSSQNMVKTYVNATLGCFCDTEYQSNGIGLMFQSYRSDGLDKTPDDLVSYLSTLEARGMSDPIQRKHICFQYVIYQKLSDYYYWIVSSFIIVYNYLFYVLAKPILLKVGFHLRTQQERLIQLTVFLCLCIDTIVLPMLIGSNFVEYGSKFLNQNFTGLNSDFGELWYKDVGLQFVVTMFLFAFSPLLDFLIEWIELSLHRMYSWKVVY